MDADKEAHLSSCVCGYHVYNAIWSATAGEELHCANRVANRIWECKGQKCYLHPTNSRCSRALTSIDFYN